MKNKFSAVVYLVICGLIISGAIYAGGKHHENCRECKLALGKSEFESGNFADTCK